jgi:hypothetical protein
MERITFALRLHEAAAAARKFALSHVEEKLPEPLRFRVRLNCSYDGNPLRSDETLYPEDSSPERTRRFIRCTEDEAVTLLWRDGKIPEWIDISVVNEIDSTTILELRCCGRFTSDEKLLYHAWQGRPPFHVVGPTLPPKHTQGQSFSIHHRSEAWRQADLAALNPHKDKVWSLELVGQDIDDHILQDLPPFPAMHLLQLRQTRVTARGLGALNRHRLFRVLNIFPPSSPSLDFTEIPRLRSLTGLNVYNAQSLRCAFGSFLLKLPSLSHLMLDCAGVLQLKGRLPKSMALLSLRAPKLEGEFAIPAQVEMLGLHLREASDSDVENLLRNLKVVRSLDLSATPVTEAFVRRAVERWPMKSINVSQTNMSRAAVAEFTAAHPNLSISPAPANNQPTPSSVSLAPQDSELSH